LQTRYFRLGIISDAYLIAWRIPNVFRRIFGEGLLNNVLLPILVKIEKEETNETLNKTISTIIIFLQILITLICFIVAYNSTKIITLLSPGAIERICYSSDMLQILIFFTFFMSFSSILGVSAQLHKNFYVGPQSQFILNLFFCIELYFAKLFNLNYIQMSMLILGNGIIILGFHLIFFFYYNFYFCIANKKSFKYTVIFFKKFFTALIGNILLESNSFLGLSISSYLQPGFLSLFEVIITLIRLPQQVFGSAIASTINIDIINTINEDNNLNNNSKPISNLIFPIIKFFLYLSIFISLSIYTFSDIFFNIFFYFTNININYIQLSSHLLFIMSLSLFPAFINRILLNIYYAKERILLSTIITLFTSIFYTFFISNTIQAYQLYALAFGYFLSDWIRFFLFYIILHTKYNIKIINNSYKKEIINIMKLIFIFFIIFCLLQLFFSVLITKIFIFKKQIIILSNILFCSLIYWFFTTKHNIK
jgi:putative peptidoglycan lipid II flippase